MLVFLITLVFWPFVLWLYWRDLKLTGLIFATICLFLWCNRALLLGEITVTHDHIGGPMLAYEYYRLFETTPFIDLFPYLSSWSPYENLGRNYFPFFYPLYNFFLLSNFYLSPMPLNPIPVYNIFILNLLIGFSTGICLVLRLITKNIFASLFVFVSCLFSNLLATSMLQGGVPFSLLYFPYLIYFVLLWLRTGSSSAFLLAVIILALGMVTYIPTIVIFPLSIFLLFYGFIKYGGKGFIHRVLSIRPKAWVTLIALCMFTSALTPVVYQHFEYRDHIIAARGHVLGPKTNFKKVKDLPDEVKGHPALVSDFMTFVIDKPFSVPNHVWHYAGPFVPYFALIGLLLGVLSDKRKIILALSCTAFMLGIISLGYRSPLFPVLNSIPISNSLRHYMFFVSFVFFFIIVLSAVGFFLWMKAILKLHPLSDYLIIVFSIAFGFLSFLYYDTKVIVASGLLMLIYFLGRAFFYYSRFSIKNIVGISAGVVIIAVGLQLVPYQTELMKSVSKPYPSMLLPKPIKIPITRNYIVPPISGPFTQLWSFVNKEAIVATPVPFHSGQYLQRTNRLLNVLYPGRDMPEVITKDISKTIYTHREPILGNDFPIFFFVPDFEIISIDCVDNEACLNDLLIKMAQHYRQDTPDKVYFFKGDVLPDLSKAQPSHQHAKITPVNIDQDKSTLHEIYGTIDAPDDGFIVRLENYHRYWRVDVDGKRERIYRGNYAFQAFPISKGHHNIHFTFGSPYPIFFMLHQLIFYVGLIMFLWIGFRHVPEQEIRGRRTEGGGQRTPQLNALRLSRS